MIWSASMCFYLEQTNKWEKFEACTFVKLLDVCFFHTFSKSNFTKRNISQKDFNGQIIFTYFLFPFLSLVFSWLPTYYKKKCIHNPQFANNDLLWNSHHKKDKIWSQLSNSIKYIFSSSFIAASTASSASSASSSSMSSADDDSTFSRRSTSKTSKNVKVQKRLGLSKELHEVYNMLQQISKNKDEDSSRWFYRPHTSNLDISAWVSRKRGKGGSCPPWPAKNSLFIDFFRQNNFLRSSWSI